MQLEPKLLAAISGASPPEVVLMDRFIVPGFVPYLAPGSTQGEDTIYIWGRLNGGEFMDRAGTRVTCNDPRIVEALEWMVKFYGKYGARTLGAFEQGFGQRARDPFIMGKVAMRMGGDFYERYGYNMERSINDCYFLVHIVCGGITC
jgi:multiple sugar transport system substrate-binding protein